MPISASIVNNLKPVQYAYVYLSTIVPQITHPSCYTWSLTSTTIAIIGIKCCMHHWYICIFVQQNVALL